MLREGFDVSNVCVIVPLRANEAPILLEQVLGRGLRLMWREPEYTDIKAENRNNLYKLKKPPVSMHDMLYVVEHPAFEKFYEDLDKDLLVTDDRENVDRGNVLGDIIDVGLKSNYADYDLFWPIIIKDREENMNNNEISIDKLNPLNGWKLEQLKRMAPNDNEDRFISEEPKIKTSFGEYKVTRDLFTATSYNEYLQRMLAAITANIAKVSERGYRPLPLLQINQVSLIAIIDKFIRTKLFDQPFDPLTDNNWRILMLAKVGIVEHIMLELSKAIYAMQNSVDVEDAIVEKHYFSEVPILKVRENFALDLVKSIYEKTPYPSNRGGLEKNFLLACDADGEVERLIKISENKHDFAKLRYIRSDGMLSSYSPDFMLRISDIIYLVETKSVKDAEGDPNVQAKRRGALDWIAKINELPAPMRGNAEWKYVLLDDTTFYVKRRQNATMKDILEGFMLTRGRVEGTLW
jgi:type III restriction enzyme